MRISDWSSDVCSSDLLDYLVGFTLSPVLWRKLPGAKSAGRVQSVTLRMIVEREREIEAFVAQQYWSITGLFEMSGTPFKARLARWRGDKIERLTIGTEGDARAAEADVKAAHFTVDAVRSEEHTSELQSLMRISYAVFC